MNMKKIVITASVDANNIKWAGKASETIRVIQEYIDKYGDGELNFSLGYDNCIDVDYEYQREETDQEYQERIARQRRNEDRERAEYEALKAKFENK